MRAVIQRVSRASVQVEGKVIGEIKAGFLVLLGIEITDGKEDCDWLCQKIVNMRIFNDENGMMNRSLTDIAGSVLLISQFTLHSSTRKGNRPSFLTAARPGQAIPLYENCIARFEELLGKPIETGKFGADMKVELLNDGPVTIFIDSKNRE